MEFMSQYDAKIVYVKGEDNTVANALSWLPTYEHAEAGAKYAYSHCSTDEEDDMVASIFAPANSPYSAAFALSQTHPHAKRELHSVCATLSISADKQLLQKIRNGYADDITKGEERYARHTACKWTMVHWGQAHYSLCGWHTWDPFPPCTWCAGTFWIWQDLQFPA